MGITKQSSGGGGSGVSVHSALTGLNADDHPHYYNAARLAGALSDYSTDAEVLAALSNYVSSSTLATTLANYAETSDLDVFAKSVNGYTPDGVGNVIVPLGTAVKRYDIEDYGAILDGEVTGFTVNSGSLGTVVLSSAYALPSDVGKAITLQWYEADGITMRYHSTTIATRDNSTTFTITAPFPDAGGSTGSVAWGTDNTAAVQACWDDMLANADTSIGPAIVMLDGAMYIGAGKCYLGGYINWNGASIAQASTMTSVRGFVLAGYTKQGSQFLLCGNNATNNPNEGCFMFAANRFRHARFENFSVASFNPQQTAFSFFCTNSNDGTWPQYGRGAQDSLHFAQVAVSGFMRNGWHFWGDANANLNSETIFYYCQAVNNTNVGTGGVVRWGHSYAAQEDQMVNHLFIGCNFEIANGNILLLDKGGHVHVIGGSWILGVHPSGVGANPNAVGAAVKMGNYSHFDNTKYFTMEKTRVELRHMNTQVIDTYWSGGNSFIYFNNVTASNDYVASGDRPNHATHIYRYAALDTAQGPVAYKGGRIPGHILIDIAGAVNTRARYGRIIIEQVQFPDNAAEVALLYDDAASPTTTGRLRRTSGGGIPKWRSVSVWGTSDGAN